MATQVTAFHYTLKDKQGQVLDTSDGMAPLAFLHGSGQIIPGLERHLAGLQVGEASSVVVAPAEAYGERKEEWVVSVKKSDLPGAAKVGDRFRGGEEDDAPIFTVVQILGEEVRLDANHPLAGKELHFDIRVTERREATEEEVAHGHVHDPNSDHHHGHSHG